LQLVAKFAKIAKNAKFATAKKKTEKNFLLQEAPISPVSSLPSLFFSPSLLPSSFAMLEIPQMPFLSFLACERTEP
jgi:hypothetical protein